VLLGSTRALGAGAATQVTSPIQAYLQELYADCAAESSGEVASYIPELAAADPEWFGICVATVDGHVYEVGDARQRFTIQSMSKPLTYGLALEERGRARVSEKVGVEPSGDAFNSISLEPETGRPLNPMINAGAMTTSSLVAGASYPERLERVLDTYSRYAGRKLGVDQRVFESERVTGHRNRAIGHMLRTFDILTENPDAVLDLYFAQCAVSVDCRDLSLMAATLANAGGESAHGRARAAHGVRGAGPERHDHVRDVQRGRRLGRRSRYASQERRLGRDPRRPPGPARRVRVLAAPRFPREQRPRGAGVPPPLA
jgi:glutaminase